MEDLLAAGRLGDKHSKFADPTRRDLLFAVGEGSTPDRPDKWLYNINERESYTRSRKHREFRQQRKTVAVPEAEAQLAAVHLGRTSTMLATFLVWAKVWYAQSHVLWPHYAKRYYHKLRLYAYSSRQRAEVKLVERLKAHLDDCALVVRDWAARTTNVRFHQPTPGIGQLRVLKRAGVEIYLIDEAFTPKICPACSNSIALFREVPNPRSSRRT